MEIKLDKVPAVTRKQLWDALIDYFAERGNLRVFMDMDIVYQCGVAIGEYETTADTMTVDSVMEQYERGRQSRKKFPLIRRQVEEMIDLYKSIISFGDYFSTPCIGYVYSEETEDGKVKGGIPLTKETAPLFKRLVFVAHERCWSWFSSFTAQDPNDKHVWGFSGYDNRHLLHNISVSDSENALITDVILNIISSDYISSLHNENKNYHYCGVVIADGVKDDRPVPEYGNLFFSENGEDYGAEMTQQARSVILDFFFLYCNHFTSECRIRDVSSPLRFTDEMMHNEQMSILEADYPDIMALYRDLIPHITMSNTVKLYPNRLSLSPLKINSGHPPNSKSLPVDILLTFSGKLSDTFVQWLYNTDRNHPSIALYNEHRQESVKIVNGYNMIITQKQSEELHKLLNQIDEHIVVWTGSVVT